MVAIGENWVSRFPSYRRNHEWLDPGSESWMSGSAVDDHQPAQPSRDSLVIGKGWRLRPMSIERPQPACRMVRARQALVL